MKQGIRILAIDDSSFSKKDKEALVVGVVGREGEIEGIMSFKAEVDGDDATDKIIRKVRASRFSDQIKLIVLNGVSVAGLNMLDLVKINKTLKLPVASMIRRKPHQKKLEKAIVVSGRNTSGKLEILRKLNKNLKISRIGGFYVQHAGIVTGDFKRLQPKAFDLLRLAHLIANGIVKGESKGRI